MVLAWDVPFNLHLLKRTARRHGVSLPELPWRDLRSDYTRASAMSEAAWPSPRSATAPVTIRRTRWPRAGKPWRSCAPVAIDSPKGCGTDQESRTGPALRGRLGFFEGAGFRAFPPRPVNLATSNGLISAQTMI